MAFRTDLAREALAHLSGDCPGVRQSTRTLSGFSVDCVEVLDRAASERLGKPRGVYCTMELDPLTRRESQAFPRAVEVLSALLSPLLPQRAPDDAPILVIGLGNRAITPDAVGPLTVQHILVTRHLRRQMPEQFSSWRPVSASRQPNLRAGCARASSLPPSSRSMRWPPGGCPILPAPSRSQTPASCPARASAMPVLRLIRIP